MELNLIAEQFFRYFYCPCCKNNRILFGFHSCHQQTVWEDGGPSLFLAGSLKRKGLLTRNKLLLRKKKGFHLNLVQDEERRTTCCHPIKFSVAKICPKILLGSSGELLKSSQNNLRLRQYSCLMGRNLTQSSAHT